MVVDILGTGAPRHNIEHARPVHGTTLGNLNVRHVQMQAVGTKSSQRETRLRIPDDRQIYYVIVAR